MIHFKKQFNARYSLEKRFRFMKSFRIDTICNSTQEQQELQRYNNTYGFIDKSTCCDHCCQKFTKKIAFPATTQLATASSIYPSLLKEYSEYSSINSTFLCHLNRLLKSSLCTPKHRRGVGTELNPHIKPISNIHHHSP